MASDLISREWIEDELQEEIEWGKENNLAGYVSALRLIKRRLKSAPAVDAEPVRHRRWIKKRTTLKYISHYECSACGSWQGMYWMNYCPNCGAKMDAKDTNVPTKKMAGGATRD